MTFFYTILFRTFLNNFIDKAIEEIEIDNEENKWTEREKAEHCGL